MQRAKIREVYSLARPFLKTRHNDIHTLISYGYALRLLRDEGGDREIVIPAILLHDVGWSSVPEHLQLTAFGPNAANPDLNRVHEVEGARLARDILRRAKYDEQKIEEIAAIIAGHDSRLEALSLNDMVVKDADKLFRFSRWGFAIHVRRFRHDPVAYRQWLGQQIDRWFFTARARALARWRILAEQSDKLFQREFEEKPSKLTL